MRRTHTPQVVDAELQVMSSYIAALRNSAPNPHSSTVQKPSALRSKNHTQFGPETIRNSVQKPYAIRSRNHTKFGPETLRTSVQKPYAIRSRNHTKFGPETLRTSVQKPYAIRSRNPTHTFRGLKECVKTSGWQNVPPPSIEQRKIQEVSEPGRKPEEPSQMLHRQQTQCSQSRTKEWPHPNT
jgi:hypothetical protein